MISFTVSGSFKKTESFLRADRRSSIELLLHKYGQEGVIALSNATPVESGLTANAWSYEVTAGKESYSVTWYNSHVVDGVPIAIILQYGHGTRTGGYVQGRDYINPAIKPIFDRIANEVWKAVTSA